jgi:pantoate--beta-alanine ligase
MKVRVISIIYLLGLREITGLMFARSLKHPCRSTSVLTQLTRSAIPRNIATVTDVSGIREIIKEEKLKGKAVTFVPTMGALHAGHISLVDAAKAHTPSSSSGTYTIASIFVNPTQFAPGEDLDKYPRTLDDDLKKLERAGVDLVFLPTVETMYGDDTVRGIVHVEPSGLNATAEAIARPQFYRGVATVVTKLLNIVQPDIAYFGQKDAGQCVCIRSLVRDLCIPTDVVIVETMREMDGLAMSSRNAYLSQEERAVASVVYQSLSKGKAAYNTAAPSRRVGDVVATVEQSLRKEPMVSKIEYISAASPHDMRELEKEEEIGEEGAVLSTAVKVGSVRLIDNVLLGGAEGWTDVK